MTTDDEELQVKRDKNREWLMWVGLLAAMFVLVWYVGDRQFIRGQLSKNDEIAGLNQKIADAAVLLAQCKLESTNAKPAQQAQRDMATAALDAATHPGKKNSEKLSQSLHKLNALRDAPGITGTTK
jgi:hypothetical protein